MKYEYIKNPETGIEEIYKDGKLIGQFYTIEQLWPRKVYLYTENKHVSKKTSLKKASGM